ncbi:MAG TPA: SurA N-terminal domain-containing protein [Anaeromyxobacteraceae bacterium]|nr:SurA N-terminal domain-containing protein [Anaeromyxobacteraceae bacterium]
MLDKLRANKGGLVTWTFLLAIIAVFILYFGPGSYSKGQGGCGSAATTHAALVNGKPVPAVEFDRQVSSLLRLYQQQTGQPLTREMAEALGVRNVALDNLVNRELVVQEAARRGMVVTDQELVRAAHQDPAFQLGGRFDKGLFERITRGTWGSPERYEALKREDLLHEKMIAALRETVKVSEAELREAFETERDRASVAYLRIPLARARAAARPTDAEVKGFAASGAARIEQFYRENASRYDTAKRVRARHVLARVAPDAPADQAEAARRRIEEAAERVRRGEDFGKVASEVSDDENTKARGGELGFLAEPLLEKPFAEAAFALGPGQVSGPVRTAAGWHLIQAEEVVEPRTIPLDDVRLDIAREILVNDRAGELASRLAREALAAARAGKRTPVTLGAEKIAWEESGGFSVRQAAFVPRLGAAPGLVEAARAAEAGDVLPEVYATAEGPAVAVVVSRERPDPAVFEAERKLLALRVSARKEQLVEQAWLETLRDGAEVVVNEPLVAGLHQAGGQ